MTEVTVEISEKSELTLKHSLTDLSNKLDGRLSPRSVLEAARDENSPLHQYFEWDDTRAGEAFRMLQASALIRRVKLNVVVEDDQPKVIQIRAFVSQPSLRGSNEGSYVPVGLVPVNELLNEAITKLEQLKLKYQHLQQLAPIWDIVDKLTNR